MQVANAKPTSAEVRAVFPSLGLAGLIPLLQAGFASPAGSLWKSLPFLAGCIMLAAPGGDGLFQFARHWGSRAVAPAFVAVIYGLVTFGNSPVVMLIALVVAFIVMCHFAAPGRVDAALRAKEEALQTAIRDRDAARDAARSDSAAVLAVPRSTLAEAYREAEMAGVRHRAESTEKALLAEIAVLKEQLDDRFPKFVADIHEIQASEPDGTPDLRAALVMNLGDSGAKSTLIAYEVEARTVHGVNITVQIAAIPEFLILLDDGRCIRYRSEHYIMTRTRNVPVERGAPVDGIIPCVFLGIKNIRELDLLSLRANFTDGTGDSNGRPQRWSTSELTSLADVDTKPIRVRIGLPIAEHMGNG